MKNILFCLSYFRTARNLFPVVKFFSENPNYNLSIFLYRQLGKHELNYNYDFNEHKEITSNIKELNAKVYNCLSPYSESKDYISESLEKYFSKSDFDFVLFDESNIKLTWNSLIIGKYFYKKSIRIAFQEGSKDHDDNDFKSMSLSLGFMYDYLFLIGQTDVNAAIKLNSKLTNRCFPIGIPYYDQFRNLRKEDEKKKFLLFISSFTKESGKSQIFDPIEPKHLIESDIIDYCTEKKVKLFIKEKIKAHSKNLAFKSLISKNVKSTFKDEFFYENLSKFKLCIGAPSTLQLLCLFLNIPTLIVSNPYSGRLSSFSNYKYLIDLNNFKLNDKILDEYDMIYQKNFSSKILGNYKKSSVSIFQKLILSEINKSYLLRPSSFLNLLKLKSIKKIVYILFPKSYKYLQNIYVHNNRKI